MASLTNLPSTTEPPGIYKTGDLILANPEESCIIFVSVILVSALLEFILQRLAEVDNRYVRIVVTVMEQEVTIVGVLALFLTFTVSLVPKRFITPLYVKLFSWAIMSLFFMACFFVIIVVFQFLVAHFDIRRWKNFEEGRMENEELHNLSYRERLYKATYDRYEKELHLKTPFRPQQLPFVEFVSVLLNKHLMRMSNLSYRTWLCLSFVVLLNLLRTRLTPAVSRSEDDDFTNALMYVFIVGFGSLLVFMIFFAMLQQRLKLYCEEDKAAAAGGATVGAKPTAVVATALAATASSRVPFGSPKRAIEFLQVVILSMNWFATLFVTGNAEHMAHLPSLWRRATVFTLFAIPLVTVIVLLQWTLLSMTLLSCLDSVTPPFTTKIMKRLRAGGTAGADDDDDDDSDDEGSLDPALELEKEKLLGILRAVGQPASAKGTTTRKVGSDGAGGPRSETGTLLSRARGAKTVQSDDTGGSGRSGTVKRPTWLDPDDEWDGTSTIVGSSYLKPASNMTAAGMASGLLRSNMGVDDEMNAFSQWRREQASSGGVGTDPGSAEASPSRFDGLFFGTLDVSRLHEHLARLEGGGGDGGPRSSASRPMPDDDAQGSYVAGKRRPAWADPDAPPELFSAAALADTKDSSTSKSTKSKKR